MSDIRYPLMDLGGAPVGDGDWRSEVEDLLDAAAAIWVQHYNPDLQYPDYAMYGGPNYFIHVAEKAHGSAVRETFPAIPTLDLGVLPEKGHHVVYRVWEGDILLYIGMSSHLTQRLAVHRRRWPGCEVTWEEYASRAIAAAHETHAIHTEHPLENIAGIVTSMNGKGIPR